MNIQSISAFSYKSPHFLHRTQKPDSTDRMVTVQDLYEMENRIIAQNKKDMYRIEQELYEQNERIIEMQNAVIRNNDKLIKDQNRVIILAQNSVLKQNKELTKEQNSMIGQTLKDLSRQIFMRNTASSKEYYINTVKNAEQLTHSTKTK